VTPFVSGCAREKVGFMMSKFILVGVFFSLMSFFFASSPAAKDEPELGPFKILICQGENLPAEDLEEEDVYSPEELAGGAYNVWCYNPGGEKVAKIHHDAPLPSYLGFSDGFYVSFTHYKDKNGDGELEEREADGYINMFVAVTPNLLKRALVSPDFTQAVVASEVHPEDVPGIPGIIEATGWFKGTTQALNRNNVHFNPIYENGILVGAEVDFINFGMMSFTKMPVPIVP
jgi:hypothetical protein